MGLASRVDPQAHEKNVGRARVVSLQAVVARPV